MALIFDSIVDTIGHTPLVRAPRCSAGLGADVAFKLESFNPMASVKDRIGLSMVVIDHGDLPDAGAPPCA